MERRYFVLTFAAIPFAVATSFTPWAKEAHAEEPMVYTGQLPGIGAGGHDVVAYFVDGRPVNGTAAHTAVHEGIVYRFANAANRPRFSKSPTQYLPQYGGYCAYAVSQGATASGDPNAWAIVDGKLYFQHSRSVLSKWHKDTVGNIARADRNWPEVVQ
ncbi:hypothetical protein Amn_pb00240 (plasmid) [Aminobacter sp. Y103A]|uniref:YHS domain-containing (seleno)protein n=1 Tax=Aminobacter sp. Y103A TaxID=1870862 RepID=UPI0025745488|nr:YHS domain-containing (seleno)protein [Aminobacter sp. SS-2016]BBD41033.1 hypothetical protein Amn_pb00240 [Aminobacter sp. SS-2016]